MSKLYLKQCKYYANGYCRKWNCAYGHFSNSVNNNMFNYNNLENDKFSSHFLTNNLPIEENLNINASLSSISSIGTFFESTNEKRSPNKSCRSSRSRSPRRIRLSKSRSPRRRLSKSRSPRRIRLSKSRSPRRRLSNNSPNRNPNFKFVDHRQKRSSNRSRSTSKSSRRSRSPSKLSNGFRIGNKNPPKVGLFKPFHTIDKKSNDQETAERTDLFNNFISSSLNLNSTEKTNNSSNIESSFIGHNRPNLENNMTELNTIEPEIIDPELIKEIESWDFTLLGKIDEETKKKNFFNFWLWQKEMKFYQLYLPASENVRQQFTIFSKDLIDYPPFDLVPENFDLNEFYRKIKENDFKNWNQMEYCEQDYCEEMFRVLDENFNNSKDIDDAPMNINYDLIDGNNKLTRNSNNEMNVTNSKYDKSTNSKDDKSTNVKDNKSTNSKDDKSTNVKDNKSTNSKDDKSTNVKDNKSTNSKDKKRSNSENDHNNETLDINNQNRISDNEMNTDNDELIDEEHNNELINEEHNNEILIELIKID